MRTALVDTRSTVGGYTQSPLETGQAVRFYVNSTTNQYNTIDATRSIYETYLFCFTDSRIRFQRAGGV